MHRLAAIVLLATASVGRAEESRASLVPSQLTAASAGAVTGELLPRPSRASTWTFGQRLALGLGLSAVAVTLTTLLFTFVLAPALRGFAALSNLSSVNLPH
ncbi:MAG: hypothetical protein K1X89_10625 [Myxococcaceae bacterium]|nr:hypothetical protein [Myxococcaceae bacterium]